MPPTGVEPAAQGLGSIPGKNTQTIGIIQAIIFIGFFSTIS